RSLFITVPSATHIDTLSLHDALPISSSWPWRREARRVSLRVFLLTHLLTESLTPHFPRSSCSPSAAAPHPRSTRRSPRWAISPLDRKSTRLNSSHQIISYAVFCLKKK